MRFIEQKYVRFFYILADFVLIFMSFCGAYNLRYGRPLFFMDVNFGAEYSLIFSLWAIVLVFFLSNAGLYYTDRMLSVPKELWKVIRSVVYSSICIAMFVFLLKMDFFSRVIFITASLLLSPLLSLWRIVKRLYLRYRLAKGYRNFNVLIIGAGRAAAVLLEEIKNNQYLGLRVKGFLDDKKEGVFMKLPVLGKIADIEQVARKQFIDEIFVTIPSERGKVRQVLIAAQNLHKTVRILAENYDFDFNPVGMNYLGIIPLLAYYERGIHGAELFFKRAFDFVISLLAIAFLSPFFILAAVAIKIDNRGPVFYISKRAGRKGRIFNFYKFRTMVVNADADKHKLMDKNEVKGGVIFKMKNDPRVTRVGKILRRYSLDELPQLFNVLKGNMSLVGPRPFPVEESQKFDYSHMPRLEIRPGITGLAQIRGRSNLSFNR